MIAEVPECKDIFGKQKVLEFKVVGVQRRWNSCAMGIHEKSRVCGGPYKYARIQDVQIRVIYPRGACSDPDFQIPGSSEHPRAASQKSNTPQIYSLNTPNKGISIHRIRGLGEENRVRGQYSHQFIATVID